MKKQDIEIVEKKLVYNGFFQMFCCRLKHRLFAGGWSPEIIRELFVRPPTVGVLLYDAKREQVVLVEQFRIGAFDDDESPWLLEIVAGSAEDETNLEQVVIREAYEESRMQIDTLVHIDDYYVSPGGTSEVMHLYCGKIDASNAGGIYGLKDEHEDILVRVMSLEQAFATLQQKAIKNAPTLISLMWLKINHKEIRQRFLK